MKKIAKSTLITSFVSGVLVLGMAPLTANAGVAGAPHVPHAANTAIQLVSSKRDEYLQKSRDEMREWHEKWDRTGEKAEAKGHEAKEETREQLNAAWAETKEKWNRLEAASGDGWDNAKRSYEKASGELREKWHKVHPED